MVGVRVGCALILGAFAGVDDMVGALPLAYVVLAFGAWCPVRWEARRDLSYEVVHVRLAHSAGAGSHGRATVQHESVHRCGGRAGAAAGMVVLDVSCKVQVWDLCAAGQ